MRYAKIRKMDISNGEGIGISLFVQGCHFHCRGCFNPETWDFNGGEEWTDDIKQKLFEIAGKPFIKRLTILGGEPLCDENVKNVYEIITEFRQLYPDKKIWVYTGYLFEDIIADKESIRYKTIAKLDKLVDGQFILEQQDLFNKKTKWAGSTNQKIIDIPKYLNER